MRFQSSFCTERMSADVSLPRLRLSVPIAPQCAKAKITTVFPLSSVTEIGLQLLSIKLLKFLIFGELIVLKADKTPSNVDRPKDYIGLNYIR